MARGRSPKHKTSLPQGIKRFLNDAAKRPGPERDTLKAEGYDIGHIRRLAQGKETPSSKLKDRIRDAQHMAVG